MAKDVALTIQAGIELVDKKSVTSQPRVVIRGVFSFLSAGRSTMQSVKKLRILADDSKGRRLIKHDDFEILRCYRELDSASTDSEIAEELACRVLKLNKWIICGGEARRFGRPANDPDELLIELLGNLYARNEFPEKEGESFEDFTRRIIRNIDQRKRRFLARSIDQCSADEKGILRDQAAAIASIRSKQHVSPTDIAELREAQECVRSEIRSLPEENRRLAEMVFIHEIPVTEAAGQLGITPQALCVRLARIRKKLEPRLRRVSPAAFALFIIFYKQAIAEASGAGVVNGAVLVSQGTTAGGSSCVSLISASKCGLAWTASKGVFIAVACTILIGVASYILITKDKKVDEVAAVISVANAKANAPERPLVATEVMMPAVGQSSSLPVEVPDDKADDTIEIAVLPGFPMNPKNGDKHVVKSDYLDVEFAFNLCGDRWFQQTEVTQRQWMAIYKLGGLRDNRSQFRGDDLPVTNITPEDANAFCVAFSNHFGIPVRLPTEDEWNLVALAGQAQPENDVLFPNSSPSADEVKELAWFIGNSSNRTKPVGGRKPNPWGVHDIFGNAAELVGNEQFGYKFMGGWYCSAAFWCKPRYYGIWDGRPQSGIGMRICIDPSLR